MLTKLSAPYGTPAQLLELMQFAVARGFKSLHVDPDSATLTIEADVEPGVGYFEVPSSVDEFLNSVEIRDFDFDPMVDTSAFSRLDLLHYVACTLVRRGEIPVVCLVADTRHLANSLLEALPMQRRLFSRFGRLELLIGVATSFVDSERMSGSADSGDRVVILTANNPSAKPDECTRAWSVLLPQEPDRRVRSLTNV